MNMKLLYVLSPLLFSLVLGEGEKIEKSANKKDKSALGDFLASMMSGNAGFKGDGVSVGYDGNNGKFGGYGDDDEEEHGIDYGHNQGYGHSVHHSGYGFKPYGNDNHKPYSMIGGSGYGHPPPYFPAYGPPPPRLIGFLVFYPDNYGNGYERKKKP